MPFMLYIVLQLIYQFTPAKDYKVFYINSKGCVKICWSSKQSTTFQIFIKQKKIQHGIMLEMWVFITIHFWG